MMELAETPSPVSVEEFQRRMQLFGVYDYIVFVSTLILCALIGVYFAFFSKKTSGNSDEDEYLMGGRNMKIIPVAFSLIASFISGISLLGTPTELYVYGTQYLFIFFGITLMGFVASYVYIPVFHDLRLSSTYEYLEKRFDNRVRWFGSVLFTISLVVWLPIVIYVPALAFNQVTGVNVHIVTPCVCIVCIYYTCVGGLRAVVWTDLVQTWITIFSLLAVIIKGTIDIGGLGVVYERCAASGRIELPSFDLDFTTRHSIWSTIIAGFIFWLQIIATSQNFTQRYMALPSLRHARIAMWVFLIGVMSILLACAYSGLLSYATYYDCDPLTTKLAKAKDQVLPLLVMKVLGPYPGMPGLFVAGVFSAALSSLSTGLNSMSAVVLEDFCKPVFGKLTNWWKNFIMRAVVVILGVISVALVFVVEKLGAVLQLSMSISGITNGSSLGIFTCGMLLPWINSTGALCGGIAGMIVSGFIIIGNQEAIASGKLKFETKPTSIDGCEYIFNTTSGFNVSSAMLNMTADEQYVFPLYRISYLWFTLIGTVVTILVATIVSYFTGFVNKKDMEPNCISPVIRKYFIVEKVDEEEMKAMIQNKQLQESIERNLLND